MTCGDCGKKVLAKVLNDFPEVGGLAYGSLSSIPDSESLQTCAHCGTAVKKGETHLCFEYLKTCSIFNPPKIPPGFEDWDKRDSSGNTMAHYMALWGLTSHLPNNFDGWFWQNNHGQSVAHYATLHKKLPPFSMTAEQWKTSIYGDTIAHDAATHRCIPASGWGCDMKSEVWGWKNNDGVTVWDIAYENGALPSCDCWIPTNPQEYQERINFMTARYKGAGWKSKKEHT